jgi:glycosyltransferase involved in cell wall biosynthesis
MKISVITPAHNAEPYLQQAVESVLGQTYPPHEMIIAENGSTDRTAEISRSFGPPVKVLSFAERTWPAVARNAAIRASTGDWLAFLDADDWLLPEKFDKQKRLAETHPNAVLLYTGVFTWQAGELRRAAFSPPEKLWPSMRYSARFEVASVMVRRDALEAVGGFNPETRYIEDWELWIKLAERYSTAAFRGIDEPLAVYRRTPGSISTRAIPAFEAAQKLVDSEIVRGMRGLERSIWRRRILAFRRYEAAILLREQGDPRYFEFMRRSLLSWPFPGVALPLRRYKIFASMVEKRCRELVAGFSGIRDGHRKEV